MPVGRGGGVVSPIVLVIMLVLVVVVVLVQGDIREPPLRTEAAPLVKRPATSTTTAIDLEVLVADHVARIPRRDEGYRVPTPAEAEEMGEAIRALAAGEIAEADRLASRHDFGVIVFTDTRTGDAHRALVEQPRVDGTLARGWGLYVLRVDAEARGHVHVHIPHPLFDVGTPAIGRRMFDRTRASSLAIAGAHRYANADGSSDVVRAGVSVFQSSHRALTRTDDRVLQVHGFAAAKYPAEMGEVVVSDGTSAGTEVIDTVAASAATEGFVICRYDGDHCRGLGATMNVQGASVRAAGADFVHVEIAREVRDDTLRLATLIDAVARGLLR